MAFNFLRVIFSIGLLIILFNTYIKDLDDIIITNYNQQSNINLLQILTSKPLDSHPTNIELDFLSFNYDKILYNTNTPEPTQILPNLYLGDRQNAQNLIQLKQLNIKHIINVAAEIPNYYSELFNYSKLPLSDSRNQQILNYFSSINAIISDSLSKNESLLIHCALGRSRSPAMVIAYLISINEFQHDYKTSLAYVKTKRNDINNINNNFLLQLQQYSLEMAK
jgi:protein-tyrosine phosphatase